MSNLGPESDHFPQTNTMRTRPLLIRMAKKQLNTQLNNPIPAGRNVHSVDINT